MTDDEAKLCVTICRQLRITPTGLRMLDRFETRGLWPTGPARRALMNRRLWLDSPGGISGITNAGVKLVAQARAMGWKP